MLGRLDSELPLLFLECPPESVRDRNSVLNRTHTHTTVSDVQEQARKKVKAKQKTRSSSSHYLHHDSNISFAHSSTLSLPSKPSLLDLHGKISQQLLCQQKSLHPSCRVQSLLKDYKTILSTPTTNGTDCSMFNMLKISCCFKSIFEFPSTVGRVELSQERDSVLYSK